MRKIISTLDCAPVQTEDGRTGTASLVEIDVSGDDSYPLFHIRVDWDDGEVSRVGLREAESLGYWPRR